MKMNYLILSFVVIGVLLMLNSGCKKNDSNDNNPSTSTVTDRDGNVYNTVTIGTQEWMSENLKVTHLNDGDDLPLVTGDVEWRELTTPAYCWYDNDLATYGDTYGALYNWYAVATSKLCPTGWHAPTYFEFTTLINHLGGEEVAGIKLREKGDSHWLAPNENTDNSSGFTALGAGNRHNIGEFADLKENTSFWSITEHSESYGWNLSTDGWYSYGGLGGNGNMKIYGFSVRCIKD